MLSKGFFTTLIFLLSSLFINAQTSTVSPYSRYGLGELQFNGLSHQIGMGRTGAAFYFSDRLNLINPASYSFDTITTIEAGFRGEVNKLSTSINSQTTNGASISYLAVGFPVMKNKWGAVFGLVPYSDVGYNITDLQTVSGAGRIKTTFQGDGGLNRFFIGNAFAPFSESLNRFYASDRYKVLVNAHDSIQIRKKERWLNFIKGFSIGVNTSWMFGTMNHTRKIEFVDSTNFLNTKITNSSSLGDFYLNYGILYTKELKNDYFLNIGITGSYNSNISSTFNSLSYNYRLTPAFLYEDIKDTVQYTSDQKGNTLVPMYVNTGFAIGKKNKWLVTADAATQEWSKFEFSGNDDQLRNSFDVAIGSEIIPNNNGQKYFQRIQYRFGLRYSKSYLSIRETSISDYGITCGFGLPLTIKKDRIQRASIHLAFEGGQKGTTKNNLLKEQYMRVHIGITLNEAWFIKRKYE